MMPQQQQLQGTVLNGEQPGANGVRITDKIYWYPNGNACEVDNCGQPAYKICDDSTELLTGWRGCGKNMCMAHCDYDIKRRRHDKFKKGIL
jgi:hypothetical protein